MPIDLIARWKISLSDVFPAFAIYIYLRFWKFSWLHCAGGCVNSTFPSLTIMMMAVGGVFGGFNVRAELRIWGAPHHQAWRERAGGGARLSRGNAGESFGSSWYLRWRDMGIVRAHSLKIVAFEKNVSTTQYHLDLRMLRGTIKKTYGEHTLIKPLVVPHKRHLLCWFHWFLWKRDI